MKRLLGYVVLFCLWIAGYVGFMLVSHNYLAVIMPEWARVLITLAGCVLFGIALSELIWYTLQHPVHITLPKRKGTHYYVVDLHPSDAHYGMKYVEDIVGKELQDMGSLAPNPRHPGYLFGVVVIKDEVGGCIPAGTSWCFAGIKIRKEKK